MKISRHRLTRGVINRVSVLALGFLFLGGVLQTLGSEMVTVNKDFNGQEIRVGAGDTVLVELEQAGAAGYTWEIQDLDTEHLELLKTKTIGQLEPGDFVGRPVIRRWLLLAKKQGSVELRFLYYRLWEGKENAVETFLLEVQIF